MTAFLFPADPLRGRRVDDHFAPQAAAARELGAPVALIDHDALLRSDIEAAVRRVPADLGPAWYRGWMIPAPEYEELAAALTARGVRLRTQPAAYRQAHELPGWYPTFAAVTPPSVWTTDLDADLAALVAPLGSGAGIVKDFVKSRKHEWDDACYLPDLSDTAGLAAVVATFVERQAESLAGGIVIRRFEKLEPGEARVWWLDRTPILIGPHPDTPAVTPAPDLGGVPRIPGFVTTDLALRADGVWRVVEVGDGQVSDLPSSLDPALLLGPLRRGDPR
ncbi:ATP-grasp domain-containing protein [Paractinoplanes durhamensis]|uniref:ATP-grasp domain-containing protein n=1 Tax=Paractinoplanes durhamensis TaxID=113563 RepID=A0ABQ3YZW3_9ACTN|nr:ATP-grasp domain-containing protein [Actinoplanes durhamensis]GIE02834.1 hypothetical protein Adu01nite_41840 [Actinoplanes durhamensis]